MDRRSFIKMSMSIGSVSILPIGKSLYGQHSGTFHPNRKAIRFGLIADVHQDIMHDAKSRLSQFVEAMETANLDFICQLGDYCQPKEDNLEFHKIFQSYSGKQYHVLGNHDMDGGFQREQTVEFFGMPHRYYRFDCGQTRFLVLDGNDPGGKQPGYAHFIAEEQANWIDRELEQSPHPVIAFIHQPMDRDGGIENSSIIRQIFEKHRWKDGTPKIVACFSGHFHQDYVRNINGIYYPQINSASYLWLPANAKKKVYSEEIYRKHPTIERVAPYQDPLWTVVEINWENGFIQLTGKETQWVGPDPWARGVSEKQYSRYTCRPKSTDWKMPVAFL